MSGKKSFRRDDPVLDILGRDSEEARMAAIGEIETAEPFISLFPIRVEVYQAVVNSIMDNGFDRAQPIILWREKGVVIDGHTRLKAAREARGKLTGENASSLDYLPVLEKSFKSQEEAIEYVYRLQFARRNITDSELVTLAQRALENYAKEYGKGSKAEFLAKRFVGVGLTKLKQLIVVIERATEEQRGLLNSNESSIYSVYMSLKESKQYNLENLVDNKVEFVRTDKLKKAKKGEGETSEPTGTFEPEVEADTKFRIENNSLDIPGIFWDEYLLARVEYNVSADIEGDRVILTCRHNNKRFELRAL